LGYILLMNRTRLLLLGILIVACVTLWVLWVNPKPVDMARFAPANSLLYLEANYPSSVLAALSTTDAWKLLDQEPNAPRMPAAGGWLERFFRVTGLGPIGSVIIARSQIAVVVTDLGTTEQGEVLKVKPEAVLILETHTAQRRVRAPVERALQELLTDPYSRPEAERSTIEGVDLVEWRDRAAGRQIVAAFYGTLVVVGNSRRSVDSCLSVIRRRAPSLKDNPDLHRQRALQNSQSALTFAYVPEQESARLISVGLPLLLARAPEGVEFQKLITQAASRMIGGLSWTARPFRGGIEDRYHISLKRDVVMRMKPHFRSSDSMNEPLISTDFYSISQYRFEDPLAAWQELKTTISAHVDSLGAIFINSMLKSSLLSYGIEDPELFLGGIKCNICTVRLDDQGDRQLLIARVGDQSKLINLFQSKMGFMKKTSTLNDTSVFENSEGSTSAAVNDSFIVVGHPADVQQYFRVAADLKKTEKRSHPQRITHFSSSSTLSSVLTYTNDDERVRACIVSILGASGGAPSSHLDSRIATLPYAATDSSLSDEGLVRITRSSMGQFSTIIPLLIPERVSTLNETR